VTLVDTNVLIDIVSDDPNWRPWSRDRLKERSALGPLLINEVVYAELSLGFAAEEQLDNAIWELNVVLQRSPKSALFLAGKAFERYRRAGGTRTGVLPDFFIGAHAQVAQCALLTRDVRHHRAYFPDLVLIAPTA
jgi:predicted nucleic acid-binding protein